MLEDRLAPAANLTITGISVVDSNDNTLSTINVGENVYIQADFTTLNLASNASYRVAFTVNGLTLDSSYITWGAGDSGTNYWYIYWGTFIATPGTNQVIVTLDPNQVLGPTTANDVMTTTFKAVSPVVGSSSFTVAQMRNAYGINSIPNFGSASVDGTGQTIAIVDADNNPTALSDLDSFDQAMSLTTTSTETLYQQYGPASSFMTVYNESGTNITSTLSTSGSNGVPPVDPTGGWEGEETLDVQWAHAIAPGAHIDLIETNGSEAFGGLFTGAATAADLPGVTVVSMSWIYFEGNWSTASGETAYDSSTFVTPANHPGVTFLAASGDGGEPGGYPAFSPNVIAVGGTQLSVNNDSYGSETGWSFPTPRTLNYGSSSFSKTGTWTSNSGGFSGTYGTAKAGSTSTATWTTTISSSDLGWDGAEVSATWTANSSNATNATYTIYNGTASGSKLASITVDQTKSPVGTVDGSYQFQELGVFNPSSGKLTVVLNAKTANGTVVADAIGISPAWAGAGGQSVYESEPSYQLPIQSTGYRTTPDVAMDGSDNSGVTLYQQGGLWYGSFGTSLACPCWAGLMAIADQGRVANGLSPFNSTANPMQALQAIYDLPSTDFNDITTGYNGYSAGPGYDYVTGLGTPIANLLIPDLVKWNGKGLTSVSLTSSPNPSVYGQNITLIAKVSVPDPGTPTANGSVSFYDGSTLLGTSPLSSGVASYRTSSLLVGNNSLTAVYNGSTVYNSSTSGGITQVVNQDGANVTLSSTPNPTVFGEAVTFVASVSAESPGSGTPTGSVTFYDGSTALNSITMTNGIASYTTSSLSVGSHTVTVTYTGSADYLSGSTSTPLSQMISQDTTSTTLTATPNPSAYGTIITFTATVSANAPGSGVPSGRFSFYDDSSFLQVVDLPSGVSTATYYTSNLSVGAHSIIAVYTGDDNFDVSTSASVNEVVNPVPTVTGVVINPGEGALGSSTYLGNSRVLSIQVSFSASIDNTSALQNAFTLTRAGLPNGVTGDGAEIGDVGVVLSNNGTSVTLTFSGANTEGGSLADGNWTLSINAADVTCNGTPMAANYTQTGILRLFGDYDDTGIVDSSDLGVMGTTFGLGSGNAAFLAAFDSDGNGDIDSTDLGRFGTNFGLIIY